MRPMRRVTLLALVSGLLLALLPAAGSQAADDPFATFDHTENMVPLGASLRPATSQYNSDIAFWGDRAYQGTYEGFRILDISDPASPQELVNFTGCAGNQGDVIVWDDILVRSWNSANTTPGKTCGGQAVLPGFEGIHVFDVSDPANPTVVGSQLLPCGSHTASGVPDLANNRLLVYNSASSATCPWNEIISIPLTGTPTPTLVGLSVTGRSCHDTAIILGDAMLKACAGGNGVTVHSLGGARGGSLTNPVELYSLNLSSKGVSIGHAASFSWDGEVLAFGHEPGGGSAARCQESDADDLKSIFFFEAATGTELGQWTLPRPQTSTENCTIHNFNVIPTTDGRRILVSGNYQAGIAVVDFTDPAAATEIAYADPAPLAEDRIILGGDWSTHWYDGEIYQSDITRGLLTWELEDNVSADTAQTLGHMNPQTQEFTIPAPTAG